KFASDVVQTFRSARHGRPEGVHYSDFFIGPEGLPGPSKLGPYDKASAASRVLSHAARRQFAAATPPQRGCRTGDPGWGPDASESACGQPCSVTCGSALVRGGGGAPPPVNNESACGQPCSFTCGSASVRGGGGAPPRSENDARIHDAGRSEPPAMANLAAKEP